jgi:hypothetical protein
MYHLKSYEIIVFTPKLFEGKLKKTYIHNMPQALCWVDLKTDDNFSEYLLGGFVEPLLVLFD